jgi:hypothetical protein
MVARVAPVALISCLLFEPASSTTLFGLLNTGEMYESADGGVTWSIRSDLPVIDAIALGAGNASSDLFLVSESGSLYRSSDGGVDWSRISSIPASDVIAFVPAPSLLMLLTRSGSVYHSLDEGMSWSGVGTITASDVVSATVAGNTHYALTTTGSVYESNDGGANWSAVGTITASDAVEIVAFDSRLWVMTGAGNLARSDDAGVSWAFVSTLSQVGTTALIDGEGELLASTAGGEVAATSDGVVWGWRGVINQLTVRALATDIPSLTEVYPAGVMHRPWSLLAPWPNPATHLVRFALDLESSAVVRLEVFDAAGRRLDRPVPGEVFPDGRSVRTWEPEGLAPGVYHLRARVGEEQQARQIVWLGR